MPTQTRTVQPGRRPGTVRTEDGQILYPPENWALLAPGDATLTRRVKAATLHWVVQKKRGRRTFSQGVWADAQVIEACREALLLERQTDAYKKKLNASRTRREKVQKTYVDDFEQAIFDYLAFDVQHETMAKQISKIVAAHATPVGSQTVARTKRIPIQERASKAVIAWMRHETTAYDTMHIPRVKGMRRSVRQRLAKRSVELLNTYRAATSPNKKDCRLAQAVSRTLAQDKVTEEE